MLVAVIISVACLAWLPWSSAVSTKAAAKDDKSLANFMRNKLDAASQVLEGLTVEDAALIQQGAQAMSEMSKAELWQVLLDEDYREFNRDFGISLRKLDQAAGEKKFDRLLLEWQDTVKSCIECHKYVRDHRAKIKK